MEQTDRIAHIGKMLYHWRMSETSTASSLAAKPCALEAARRAKLDAIGRRGLLAEVELVAHAQQYRVVYHPRPGTKLSIIIPSKDHCALLERCLRTFKEHTVIVALEVEFIIVDNGSTPEQKALYEDLCAKTLPICMPNTLHTMDVTLSTATIFLQRTDASSCRARPHASGLLLRMIRA